MVPNHPVDVIGEGLSIVNDQGDNNKVVPPQLVINHIKYPLQVSKLSNSNTARVLNLLRLPDGRGV